MEKNHKLKYSCPDCKNDDLGFLGIGHLGAALFHCRTCGKTFGSTKKPSGFIHHIFLELKNRFPTNLAEDDAFCQNAIQKAITGTIKIF